jgi:hypothetical protein
LAKCLLFFSDAIAGKIAGCINPHTLSDAFRKPCNLDMPDKIVLIIFKRVWKTIFFIFSLSYVRTVITGHDDLLTIRSAFDPISSSRRPLAFVPITPVRYGFLLCNQGSSGCITEHIFD